MADSVKTVAVKHAPVIAHLKALGFKFECARQENGQSLGIFEDHPDLRAAEEKFLADFQPLRTWFKNRPRTPKRRKAEGDKAHVRDRRS